MTIALLTGSRFVPPALVVLGCLPEGTRVELVPEPSNPYDALAIKVVLEHPHLVISDRVLESRAEDLASCGSSPTDVLMASSIPLGHIAASSGKPLEKARSAAPRAFGPIVGTEELASGLRPDHGRLHFSGENIWITLLP